MAVTVENMDVTGQLCISIAEAARRVGCSRSKLYRDIRSGKLPVVEDNAGKRLVEPGELARIYDLDPDPTDALTPDNTDEVVQDDPSTIATLQDEIATLRARIEQLETDDTPPESPPAVEDVVETPEADEPVVNVIQPAPVVSTNNGSSNAYYVRKPRSRLRRVKRFMMKAMGVLGLIVVTTAIVIAFTHVISLSSG